jgi:hypothetical protein
MSNTESTSHLSRRELAAALAATITATSRWLAFASPAAAERATATPSEFLRKSDLLMGYHTRYGIPLDILESRAEAAWRLHELWHSNVTTDEAFWTRLASHVWRPTYYDQWTYLAARLLGRAYELHKGGAQSTGEFRTIVAILGADLVEDHFRNYEDYRAEDGKAMKARWSRYELFPAGS